LSEIQNPNRPAQSGGDARSLLLLTLMIFLVVIGFRTFKPNLNSPTASSFATASTPPSTIAAKTNAPVPPLQHSWLDIIADPLYRLLRALHSHLDSGASSWGWTIILFTCILNLCILPLRLATLKSSLKMMRLRPSIETINKKYAHLKNHDSKKAEMQAEIMAMYKSEGVNMYGSCLPALLPMPFLIAMYRVLTNAGELHHAHWCWLFDLAAPDPMHILPIFIIVTMFLTQWITPQPGADATQRRMMLFLIPVIMGFTMWRFSSGLSLYWATGNLIALGVQLVINNSKIGREMRSLKVTGKV
jgi:YidC/Oxa1 family membrane protein insertase